MKTKWLSLALLMLSSYSWAQAGALFNAEVSSDTAVSNPSKVMKAAEGQWLAFSLPALAGTRSPCCWQGKWNGMGEAGCSLQTSHQSYGTRSDSPLAENVIVFSQLRDGQVQSIRVVGESCPVDAGGARVNWIGSVDETDGLNWLEGAARLDQGDSVGGSVLFALGLHRSPEAGQRLYLLARDVEGDLSEEAIFWLGESRGPQGFRLLRKLLAELPEGDERRTINFALAENNSDDAAALLFDISKSDSDSEQRGEAMFWLAEAYPQKAQGWLLEVLETEQDEDVLEQAVFAISQLPEGAGDQALLELAQNKQVSRAVRRQAIFWLAQSDDDSSVAALTELLTR
jgi:hypothetical protein